MNKNGILSKTMHPSFNAVFKETFLSEKEELTSGPSLPSLPGCPAMPGNPFKEDIQLTQTLQLQYRHQI